MAHPHASPLLDQPSRSQIFTDYQQAFAETTGMPLSLRPVAAKQPVHRGSPHENPFCMVMAKTCRFRLRVEKAKNLLLNPKARLSEIACEVGFHHFNRVFRKVIGQSPTEFRERLPVH